MLSLYKLSLLSTYVHLSFDIHLNVSHMLAINLLLLERLPFRLHCSFMMSLRACLDESPQEQVHGLSTCIQDPPKMV